MKAISILALATFAVSPLYAAAPLFTRILNGPIATDLGISNGCAWGDYDNDGYEDLFISNSMPGAQNFFYRNNRDGTFTKVLAGDIVTDGGNSSACVWTDFDNDGLLDLFVTNPGDDLSARGSSFYRNKGDGTFKKIVTGPVVTDLRVALDASWADYDRDGYLDLFVGDFNGAKDLFYQNRAGSSFDRKTSGPIPGEGGIVLTSAWADYDNDGLPDLFVVNWDSHSAVRNFLYRNQGDGTFVKITSDAVGLLKPARSSVGCAWGDYDNDGFPDLFVCRGGYFSAEKNSLYHNNGNGTFTEVTSSTVSEAGFYGACAWGDYDNDGFLDLFLAQMSSGGDNVLYHNNGDGSFTKVSESSLIKAGGVSHACAWADYDNDGFLDLVVANTKKLDAGASAPNFLYHNTGNTNSWLKLKLVGTVSNRAAIGAKIRIKAIIGGTTVSQVREIAGGGGWGAGQNSLIVHFGLRDASIVDNIRIEWPSGIVQELQNVPADRLLTVSEPARLQSPGPGIVRIQSWKGMTFGLQSSSDLNRWNPVDNLTNLTGILDFTDSSAKDRTQRFYRTVSGN